MHGVILSSGRDAFLIAIPFLAILIIGFFRLDEIFAAHPRSSRRRGPVSGLDADGEPLLCDPDGRRWH
jgi:hypothetical protein